MSSEAAVSVSNLSKVYRIYDRPEHRLLQMATLGRMRRFKEFAALSNVSLEVGHGETVGIIGRNGCGKSTLLQVICGTLQPSAGTLAVNGRIAALLELGAGFNGEFTGRENAYMNGAILGLSREEMDARFEGIAQFASIGDFIERPVKTYSSGMYVRLAFAVATAVEPDILVVDEALAVGDEAFQRKCFARIEAIKERGGTILFVSHGAQTIVQLCDRAVLLDAGEKLLDGEPKLVVSQYQRLIAASAEEQIIIRNELKTMTLPEICDPPVKEDRLEADRAASDIRDDSLAVADDFDAGLVSESTVIYESQGARISDIHLENSDGQIVNVINFGREYRYCYSVEFDESSENAGFGMAIRDVTGLHLFGQSSDDFGRGRPYAKGSKVSVKFPFLNLFSPGTYFGNAGVGMVTDGELKYAHRILDGFAFRVNVLGADTLCSSLINLRAGPVMINSELEQSVHDQ